jgi:RNA polymerase sigma factor (sigma-70 family)
MIADAERISDFLAATGNVGTSDAELLNRFVAERDGSAFATLVARHGTMVFGVCRRVIHDWHLAEDAYQATFLVLARRAAIVSPPGSVAGWLHGVAYRVAKSARHTHLRRTGREHPTDDPPEPATPDAPDADLRDMIDGELQQLPGKFRNLIVACDLEERDRRSVATALGIPEGTLSSRLTAARKMLARRLAQRGIAPSSVALVALGGPQLVAWEVPRRVLESAAQLGCTATGMVPAAVASLAAKASRMMTSKALVPATVLLLTACGAMIAALTAGDAPPTPQPPVVPDSAFLRHAEPKAATPVIRADDAAEGRAIVAKSVEAIGAKAESKPLAMTCKEEGVVTAQGIKIPYECEWAFMGPDYFRSDMTIKPGGSKVDLVTIWREESGSILVMGQSIEMMDEQRVATINAVYAHHVLTLVPLLTDKAFKLTMADEKTVDGKMAQAIKVEREKRPTITLYFDKESWLLVKSEMVVKAEDQDWKEVLQETYFKDYKERDGRKVHTKESVFQDGIPTMESTLSEHKFHDRLDAKLFEKPLTTAREKCNKLVRIFAGDQVKIIKEFSVAKGTDRDKVTEKFQGLHKEYADKFYQLAEENPKDPVAVDALFLIVQIAGSHAKADEKVAALIATMPLPELNGKLQQVQVPWSATLLVAVVKRAEAAENDPLAIDLLAFVAGKKVVPGAEATIQKATTLLVEKYPNHPALERVCRTLASGGSDSEKTLKRIVEMATSPKVKAMAVLALGQNLSGQLDWFDGRPEDADKLAAEAEKSLARAVDLFGAEKMAQQKASAESELNAFRTVRVGKVAPEINGKDLDGKEFKLSDYRGKVVLLAFWANWCGPCRAMYPFERSLVKSLSGKPFALVGVNSDPDLEILKPALKKGNITWRSFTDGPDAKKGPIYTAWNVQGWPTFFLIDHQGVIRRKCDGPGMEGLLEEAIEQLVKEAEKAAMGGK